MYRVAICDDEKLFLDSLYSITAEVLREMGVEYDIDRFQDAGQLLNQLNAEPSRYQMLLLDGLMDHNGIQLARELREKGNNVSIVFVTNAGEYSLEGYSVYPINFLLKPVKKEELAGVLARDYRQNFRSRNIVLPVGNGMRALPADDVQYIEILNRTTIFHMCAEAIQISGTLKRLEPYLPEEIFLRCHKSFCVNMNKIVGMSGAGFQLSGGMNVPIGRAYRKDAVQRVIEHMHSR